MPTSVQVRNKIADVVAKRSKVDQEIGKAERRKAAKEAEAADKNARAARTSSASQARMYRRQAETALNAALAEGKKIASLTKKRADLSKEEATQNKALTDALKRETTANKRAADRERRSREAEVRQQEAQRREVGRQRQADHIEAELQRQADRTETHTMIEEVEARMAAHLDALREPQDENLRILYATATATAEGELRVAQEVRRVKNAVNAALHRDRVDIEIAPDVTADDLLNYLTSFQPHVIHFSGHANEDVLVFDDGTLEGGEREIPIEVFMRAVSAPDHKPTLIVLNACNSAGNLEPLLASVPVAIGMSASVGDADAITFATRFYRAIADGQSISGALAIARSDMELNGLSDHDLPTLVVAPGFDPSDIRLVLAPGN